MSYFQSDHIRFDLTQLLHSLQGSSVPPRRSHNQESNHYFDSDLTSRGEQTLFSDRYHRHLRQPYPNGLSEVRVLLTKSHVLVITELV